MRNHIKNLVMLLFLVWPFMQVVWAQPKAGDQLFKSPINDLSLVKSNRKAFSFMAVGHVAPTWSPIRDCMRLRDKHGWDQGYRSVYPAVSFVANLDWLGGEDFMVLLGDSVGSPLQDPLKIFRYLMTQLVHKPVFNALGNHDVISMKRNLQVYRGAFGPEYYYFIYKGSAFVFLSTGDTLSAQLGRDQIAWANALTTSFLSNNQIKRVFYFAHRVIWLDVHPYLERIMFSGSMGAGYRHNNLHRNQFSRIYSGLKKLAKIKPVYVLSGDRLLNERLNQALHALYYFENPLDNITYVETALADSQLDLALKVTVNHEGKTTFSPISLLTRQPLPLKRFTHHLPKVVKQPPPPPKGLLRRLRILEGRR